MGLGIGTFQDFSNVFLQSDALYEHCSPDPTANSKTTNPNFHKIFGQFICNLIGYEGQLIVKKQFHPKYQRKYFWNSALKS